MKNNLVGLVVGILAAVLLMGTLMVPMIDDVTAQTREYTNEGVPYAAYDGETHTIVVSYEDSELSITSDGESCELPDFTLYDTATIVYGSDGFLRISSEGVLQVYSETYASMTAASDSPVTVTVSDSGITMTNGTSTKTGEFTPLAYISTEGDYVLAENPCVVSDSSIIVIAGYTNISSGNRISFLANGTLDALSVSTAYLLSADSLTVSSVSAVANTSVVDGELVQIDSIVFTAVMSDDSEWTGTYTYFLAPTTVEYDNPDYIGDISAPLLAVIPLFTILAVFCAVVYAVIRNRD